MAVLITTVAATCSLSPESALAKAKAPRQAVRKPPPENHPPTITIISPEAKVFLAGDVVNFVARVRDPDLEHGDEVLCFWNVDGVERTHGVCRWRWDLPRVGVHQIEVVARDRQGAEARLQWQLEVKFPDPRPLVDHWLQDYCRSIEAAYKAEGEEVVVSWRGLEISGNVPSVTVSFIRIDRLAVGAPKEFPKRAQLSCTRSACSGSATGG